MSAPLWQLTEGWHLLTRVLVEVADADDTVGEAAAEEDRTVGKLLMFLGSNVTNRRERDACAARPNSFMRTHACITISALHTLTM